jgi:hypothetical protein
MAVVLGMIAAATALLAAELPWRQLETGQGVVRLSIRHATEPKVPCKPLTPEEMATLKPNMRRSVDCPRERWPITVELVRDGRLLYRGTHQPSGLWSDGVATVHRAFAVPAGPQALTVRMRDSGRADGFDHVRTGTIDLQPGQNLVIEFAGGTGFSWQ